MTLTPGVYTFPMDYAMLTGTLTLDAENDIYGQFIIFLIDSSLTAASEAEVVLINGAQAGDVYYIVGTSATLGVGVGTLFQGNIIASASVSLLLQNCRKSKLHCAGQY